MTPDDLPPSLKDLYVGKDGRYQIKVIPKEDVWNFDKLDRFVSELRKVDPEVSGVPVGVLESARLMHRTFLSAAALTIALVIHYFVALFPIFSVYSSYHAAAGSQHIVVA